MTAPASCQGLELSSLKHRPGKQIPKKRHPCERPEEAKRFLDQLPRDSAKPPVIMLILSQLSFH